VPPSSAKAITPSPCRSSSRACSATALHRLMEQYQQTDPFKFLIYAEHACTEIGPVR
jgi:hypothetical protein